MKGNPVKGASKKKKPTAAAIKKLVRLHDKYMQERILFMQTYGVSSGYVNGLLIKID